MSSTHCTFCGRPANEPLSLGSLDGSGCLPCATHLGRLLSELPFDLFSVWPLLREEDEAYPEPRVRLPDGRSVELRHRTAELKEDLPVEKRAELAELYGIIGLEREQVLEAGYVLSVAPNRALAQRALDLIFAKGRASPEALSILRRHLMPC